MKSNCLCCGREFDYYLGNSSGKFCSRECYQKSIKIPEKECIVCGKLYTPDKGNKKEWDKSKYCSLDCLHQGHKKGSFVRCSYCKKSIWRKPRLLKKNKDNFCSRKCKDHSLRGKSTLKLYKKGYRGEKDVEKILRNDGYITIRNFLSWGVFDICAIKEDHIRFIQVKRSKKNYPISYYKQDINNMILYNVPDFANKELWRRVDYSKWQKYTITENSIKKFEDQDLNKISGEKEIIWK